MPSPLYRLLTLAALLLAGFIYTALLWHSNFYMAALQIFVAAMAWWNRRWPLYALALIFPLFGNQPGAPYGMHFIDLTLWLILAIWLFNCVRAHRCPFALRPIGIWLSLAWIWAFVALIPHLPAQARALSWRHGIADRFLAIYQESVFGDLWPLHAFLGLTQSLLFFFYVKDQFSVPPLRRQFLRVLLISTAAAMFFGLLDFFHILPLDWFRPPNPEILRFGSERLQSFFWHSGWLAEWLILLAPFSLACLLLPSSMSERKKVPLFFLAAWIAMSALVILLTYQRGGWLALAAGWLVVSAAAFALYQRSSASRRQANRLIIGLAIIACLAVAILGAIAWRTDTALGERLRNIGAIRDRQIIWKSALTLAGQHPVLGIGIGGYFKSHLKAFPEGHPFFELDKGEAHSTYLQFFAERGIPGLLLFLALMLAMARLLLRRWREIDPGDPQAAWIVGGLGLLAAYAVYGIVQYMDYIRVVELTFVAMLACVTSAAQGGANHEAAVNNGNYENNGNNGIYGNFFRNSFSDALQSRFPQALPGLLCGIVWLALPLVIVFLGQIAFGAKLAPIVWHLSAASRPPIGQEFIYLLYLSAGMLPWILMGGILWDALAHQCLSLRQVAFINLFRTGIFGLWTLFFVGMLAFFLQREMATGPTRIIALLIALALTSSLAMALAGVARLLFRNRLGLSGILLLIVAFILFFAATPILYPYSILPRSVQTFIHLNPALASVRIMQKLHFDQQMPSTHLWRALIVWNILSACAYGLIRKYRKPAQDLS